MAYNIVLTTAEDIVAVVDAVVAKGENANKTFISEFTGIATDDQVEKALQMALALNLIKQDISSSLYSINTNLAVLLVSAKSDEQKAAIMRLTLEQYHPYKVFKERYRFTNSIDIACKQTKVLCSVQANERDIKNTLISIATYAKALKSEGANLYSFVEEDTTFSLINTSLSDNAVSEMLLRDYFGESLYSRINTSTIETPLSSAFQKSKSTSLDERSVVVNAANAFESFLDYFANIKGISLSGRNGILQKRDALSSVLSKKHRGMIDYIGQVRNAADHGADPDEGGQMWVITKETTQIYPCIVAITIKDILRRESGIIEV